MKSEWVDRIFALCATRYGRPWASRWDGLDMDAVRADWARVLSGFDGRPEAIRYALENLPEAPPTATEFRAICRRAPEPDVPRIQGPQASPEAVRAAAERRTAPAEPRDPKQWARDFRDAERRGERLTQYQRDSWRAALRADLGSGDAA